MLKFEFYQNIAGFVQGFVLWVDCLGFWGTLAMFFILLGLSDKLRLARIGFSIVAFFLFSFWWAIAFVIVNAVAAFLADYFDEKELKSINKGIQEIVDAMKGLKEAHRDHRYDE